MIVSVQHNVLQYEYDLKNNLVQNLVLLVL